MKSTYTLLAILAAATLMAVSCVRAQKARTTGSPQTYGSRAFLRWERPTYSNYAIDHFQTNGIHAFPYDDNRRTIYGPIGDYLVNGYDLYTWEENRIPGQQYSSAIFKPNEMCDLPWEKVYNSSAVLKDGYGDWGFSFAVGDNMIARLSPMTLSMVDFNGIRWDFALPRFEGTLLASRIEPPHTYQEVPTLWAIGKTQFADDSPRDGIAGASVQDVQLIVNGDQRPDIVPLVVSNPAGIRPQVGTVSSATGRSRATDYTLFSGHRLYYRGRTMCPCFPTTWCAGTTSWEKTSAAYRT